jgi:hypothetical protein
MIFSVGAGSAPDRGRLVAHTARRAQEQPALRHIEVSNPPTRANQIRTSMCRAKIQQLACMDESDCGQETIQPEKIILPCGRGGLRQGA